MVETIDIVPLERIVPAYPPLPEAGAKAVWRFGMSRRQLLDAFGTPDEALPNYTGEVEMLYGDCFARFFDDRLVECTFPDLPERYRFRIDGVDVLSLFEWLGARDDVIDRARFRICTSLGLAYDFRNPAQGSVTVFEAHRWDALLQA
ncbi:MAG: hypothetical protein AAF513_09210 [Pseudomonadota bacterium]